MDKVLNGGRILRLREVCEYTGLGRSTIYAKVSCQEAFSPLRLRLGSRSVGWRLSDIDAWLQAPERKWDPAEVK